MIIANGEDRIAFVGERLTVKVAKAKPGQFGARIREITERKGFAGIFEDWKGLDADQHHSLRNYLLHGIMANRRERRIAKNFGKVVVPTASVLGGAINLQRTASPVELPHREVHRSFAEQLGPRVTKLGHMLEDTANLGISDGRVSFVDGGSEGLESLMESNPTDIEMALNSIGAQNAKVQ